MHWNSFSKFNFGCGGFSREIISQFGEIIKECAAFEGFFSLNES